MDIINTIDKIGTNPYVLTTYQVKEAVSNLNRTVNCTSRGLGGMIHTKSCKCYTNTVAWTLWTKHAKIRNLVTDKEYVVDVTHILTFYFVI